MTALRPSKPQQQTVCCGQDSCTFDNVGGSGLLLYRYVRNAVIQRSEFVRIGAHAIMSVGTSQMVDGTGPDHPHGTKVLYNFAHEIGIQEKQSKSDAVSLILRSLSAVSLTAALSAACFWMQAMTTATTLVGNIGFNSAR